MSVHSAFRRSRVAKALALCLAGLAACPAAFAASPLPDSAYLLDLGGTRFDLRQRSPRYARGSDSGPNLRLLQFQGPIRAEWLTALRAAGVEPLQYIHPYSYVVWADAERLRQVTRREEVRASGDFLPEFRISQDSRGLNDAPQALKLVVSRKRDPALRDAQIRALGAQITSSTAFDANFELLQLQAPGSQIEALAALAGVYAVQRLEPMTEAQALRGEMSQQSVVGGHGEAPDFVIAPGYEQWLIGAGYDGSGVIAGIVDGGLRSTHKDLLGQTLPCISGADPSSCSPGSSDHGTHVAAAVAGSGASDIRHNGFLRGQGVAPGAKLVSQRYGPFIGAGPGGLVAAGMLKIFRESALSGAVLTNNSWGPAGSPKGYDIPSREVDVIVRDALADQDGAQPILAVWSVMNGNGDGQGACQPSSLGSPDEAKNLLAVGSTRLASGGGGQVAGSGIFDVSSNSAHGPACDGRQVPHLVAPGCLTDSASGSGDTAFNLKCGTSMASPVVSGAAALFIEKYRDSHDGATPSPALVKAAITVVARDLAGQKNADGDLLKHRPDRFQGYGRLDLAALMQPDVPVLYFEQDQVFSDSGQQWSQTFWAADPAQPVRLMLVWTDAPGHGLGGSTPAWVNDLDLEVHLDGRRYHGNAIGEDGWSSADGQADGKNNMEAIHLSAEQHAGMALELRVKAVNIAADALNPHAPGAPAQDFALVCHNCKRENWSLSPSKSRIFKNGFEPPLNQAQP